MRNFVLIFLVLLLGTVTIAQASGKKEKKQDVLSLYGRDSLSVANGDTLRTYYFGSIGAICSPVTLKEKLLEKGNLPTEKNLEEIAKLTQGWGVCKVLGFNDDLAMLPYLDLYTGKVYYYPVANSNKEIFGRTWFPKGPRNLVWCYYTEKTLEPTLAKK